MSQIAEKCRYPKMSENPFKKLLNLNPEVDDFQNLISSSSSKDTFIVKFHEDPFSSFYVKLLIDRQTGEQKNICHVRGNNERLTVFTIFSCTYPVVMPVPRYEITLQ